MLTDGKWYSVEYDTFPVESEASNYKIHVTGYSGDVYDVMNYGSIRNSEFHNGMKFTTYDRDNEQNTVNKIVLPRIEEDGGITHAIVST